MVGPIRNSWCGSYCCVFKCEGSASVESRIKNQVKVLLRAVVVSIIQWIDCFFLS